MIKLYVLAPKTPAKNVHRTRYSLEDATELAAKYNYRFPNATMFVWKINTDGSLVREETAS